MAESKLRELSIDLYNRCGTIRRILVASINTAKENLQKEKINSKSKPNISSLSTPTFSAIISSILPFFSDAIGHISRLILNS